MKLENNSLERGEKKPSAGNRVKYARWSTTRPNGKPGWHISYKHTSQALFYLEQSVYIGVDSCLLYIIKLPSFNVCINIYYVYSRLYRSINLFKLHILKPFGKNVLFRL